MKSNFIFAADIFLSKNFIGGGEINNEELITLLKHRDHTVHKLTTNELTPNIINNNSNINYIIANFIGLSEESKLALKGKKYIIYEHDHKYLKSRNPADYPDYKAPDSEIVNKDFYKNALAVCCQSNFHVDIVKKNLNIDNIINLGGNLWSEATFDKLESVLEMPKQNKYAVLDSNIWHKNTQETKQFCDHKNWDYQLVKSNDYFSFLEQLGKNQKFIFLPKTPETLSRVVVEARMMGATVVTNKNVGATKEEWFSLSGKELIDIMKHKRTQIPQLIESIFHEDTSCSK